MSSVPRTRSHVSIASVVAVASVGLLVGLSTAADADFGPATNYPAPEPYAVAVGDVNGDAAPDLVTANWSTQPLDLDTVSVRLNNGNGTFAAAVNYPAGQRPMSVAIGDVNGDTKPDLAVADFGVPEGDPDEDPPPEPGGVSILLGNGNGTFAPPVSPTTGYAPGDGPVGVGLEDLDSDNSLDIVLTNPGNASVVVENVSVLLGNGDGTFGPQVNYAAGSRPERVAIGDLNGDDDPDLAVANCCAQDPNVHGVSVLLNNGDGSFAAPVSYTAPGEIAAVAIGDLDGDTAPDVAVGGFDGGDGVSVLLNNGDGTLLSPVNYPISGEISSVAIGDLNRDGKADLAAANYFDNEALMFLGTGDGTLLTPRHYTVGFSPTELVAADVNGDTHPDLVTANLGNSVSVLLNIPPPTVTITPNSGPKGIAVSLSGAGYSPGEKVKINYKTGLPSTPNVLLCKATATVTGNVACNGHIPTGGSQGARGAHAIVAKGTVSMRKATTTFTRT